MPAWTISQVGRFARWFAILPFLCALCAFSAAQTGSDTISRSGGTVTFGNPLGALTVAFEEIIAGSPATVSIVIQGCMQGGTCSTVDTYTTVANSVRQPTVSLYDYFSVAASWTGGSQVSVTINATLSTVPIVSGGGGTVTGSGTEYSVPLWNNAAGTQLGNSLLSQDSGGTTVTDSGKFAAANTLQVTPTAFSYIDPNAATLVVTGSVTSGTFSSGEALLQTNAASATLVGTVVGSGPMMITAAVIGASDASDPWVGQTSGAIFTPTAIPVSSSPSSFTSTVGSGVDGVGYLFQSYGSGFSFVDNLWNSAPSSTLTAVVGGGGFIFTSWGGGILLADEAALSGSSSAFIDTVGSGGFDLTTYGGAYSLNSTGGGYEFVDANSFSSSSGYDVTVGSGGVSFKVNKAGGNVEIETTGGSFNFQDNSASSSSSYAEITTGSGGQYYTANNGGFYFNDTFGGEFNADVTGGIVLTGSPTTVDSLIDSALTPGTSPVCPNGSGGALVNTGCATGALTGTTGSIGGSLLTIGTCSSGTVSVTGASTSMVATASPVTYPGDGNYWLAYVSAANTVTVKVCAVATLTPTASIYNVRVQ